ncbi:SH3 domain-containing protein [Streptomyces sp. NPDC006335]|uniref:SH3 domain-containing protein n=1 Tax=Streptomyces sp. NPDC006335 TaxID=3156895 RepID=UPI0033A1C92F
MTSPTHTCGTLARRIRLAGQVVATAAALPGLAASPVSAWTGGYVSSNAGFAYVREAATTDSAILGTAPNGRTVDVMCWKHGDRAKGDYWTNRWFYSTVQSNGTDNWVGYVHASLVARHKTVPHC